MKKFIFCLFALFYLGILQGEIKAVVFDYGGVLMHFKNGYPTQFISDSFGASFEEVRSELKKSFHRSLTTGAQNEEEYWQNFATKLQVSCPKNWIQMLQHYYHDETEYNSELLKVCASLRSEGYLVGILSNQIASLAKTFHEDHRFDSFDPVIISCEVKAAKPDPAIYMILLKKISLKPEEILFIDDKKENLRVAERLGIQTIHYKYGDHTIEEFISRLKVHGVTLE